MKLLAPLIVILLLVWSWNKTHETSSIPFATHAFVQNELRELLEKNLLLKNPEIKEFSIKELWTAPLHEGSSSRMIAYVTYAFAQPMEEGQEHVQQQIRAEILLEKVSEAQAEQVWAIKSFRTPQENIVFEEGLKIIAPSEEGNSDPNAEP